MARSTGARRSPRRTTTAAKADKPSVSAQQSLLPKETTAAVASVPLEGLDLDDGFSGPQVCTLVGISYRQLDYWARTGFLKPSIAAAKGSGTKRRYSYRDLVQLKVIKQILDADISLRSARRAIECLRSHLGEDMAATKLVLTGSSAVLVDSDGDLIDLLAGGQGVLNIVPMASVVRSLDADIVRLTGKGSSRKGSSRNSQGSLAAGPPQNGGSRAARR